MSGRTGDQCSIFDKIDGLDGARTVEDLVRRLKPILNELAYCAITGDAATQTSNEWHEEFSDSLLRDHATDKREAAPPPLAPSSRPAAPKVTDAERWAAADARARPAADVRSRPTSGKSGKPRAPRGAPPPVASLPPSLRAIMEGTHESFDDP